MITTALRSLPVLTLLAAPLSAHEFWLRPATHFAAPDDTVEFALRVGMDFQGEPRPFTCELVTAFNHFTASGRSDEYSRVPATAVEPSTLSLPLAGSGTHLLAVDTIAKSITLEAEKFNDYLREDGLDRVLRLRAERGQEKSPGRELYRRCVKTLVRVGESSDTTYATRTGQRLEIVPRADPFATRPGGSLGFTVFFDDQPLAGALVRAWHRQGDKLTELPARTAADGTVAFTLPFAGDWMISVVHMVPLVDAPGYDWQSYWGNLTFAIPTP